MPAEPTPARRRRDAAARDVADPAGGIALLVTCEHGGNEVPGRWRKHFRGEAAVLRSHRGFDPGARAVAERLAIRLAAPLVCSTTTRLLVDLNRSIGHPRLLGPAVRTLPPEERDEILEAHYHPHRRTIERLVGDAVAAGRAIRHLAVHTCADELDGRARELEVSFLFDPARPGEAALVRAWRSALRRLAPDGRYPFNRPYRGTADGLTTALRARFGDAAYAGIEIELRQGIVASPRDARAWADRLADALPDAVPALPAPASVRRGPSRPRRPRPPGR